MANMNTFVGQHGKYRSIEVDAEGQEVLLYIRDVPHGIPYAIALTTGDAARMIAALKVCLSAAQSGK